jgi:hypothetical protein
MKAVKAQTIHMPRLDTVLMVEDTIKKLDYYPTKNQLWRALPKMVMWQTFTLILDYLERSNKIVIDNKREIVWIFADNPKIKEVLAKSIPYKSVKR